MEEAFNNINETNNILSINTENHTNQTHNKPLVKINTLTLKEKSFHLFIDYSRRFSDFKLYNENNTLIENVFDFINSNRLCYTNTGKFVEDKKNINNFKSLIYHEICCEISLYYKSEININNEFQNKGDKDTTDTDDNTTTTTTNTTTTNEIMSEFYNVNQHVNEFFTIKDIEIYFPKYEYPLRKFQLLKSGITKNNYCTNNYIKICISQNVMPSKIIFKC